MEQCPWIHQQSVLMCAFTNHAITAKQVRVRLRFADIIRGFVELQNSVVNQILIFKELILQLRPQ
jgi:hypothetical protein